MIINEEKKDKIKKTQSADTRGPRPPTFVVVVVVVVVVRALCLDH